MLIVRDEEHLAKTKEFAASRELLPQLNEELSRLDTWFGGKAKTTLFPDHAPYSFYFILEDEKGQTLMNGGLLYYRAGDTGVSSPQFSVRFGGNLEEGWRVHT